LLNALQKWQLEQFCRKHEVDTQEIDEALTYSENKQHLQSHVLTDVEENLDEGESMEQFYNSVTLEEQADLETVEPEKMPYLFFYSLVKFNKHQIVEFRRYADKFGKHVEIMYRTHKKRQFKQVIGYAFVKGNVTTVTMIIDFLKTNGMYVRILKTSLSYKFLKQYRYAQGTWYNTESFGK